MLKRVFAIFLLLVLVFSCGEESFRNTIPYAPVSFIIHPDGMDHELRNPLTFKIYTEEERRLPDDRMGYAGLLVVTGSDGEIYAYDRCCPYEDNRKVTVEPQEDGKARCPVCGSLFVTIYGLGSPVSGAATESLQNYRVIPLQDGTFRIIN